MAYLLLKFIYYGNDCFRLFVIFNDGLLCTESWNSHNVPSVKYSGNLRYTCLYKEVPVQSCNRISKREYLMTKLVKFSAPTTSKCLLFCGAFLGVEPQVVLLNVRSYCENAQRIHFFNKS